MLISLIRDIFSTPEIATVVERKVGVKCVLNVGGGSKSTPIPSHFAEWRHDLLDIDPRGAPDIVCDARELEKLQGGIYDAVYCSHNLEHYYRHHGLAVVRGFHHILNETGFAEIRVPDIAQVIAAVLEQQLELDDVLYQSPAGPIAAHDVIYGLQTEIETSGQDFYAHKTGFTPKSLSKILADGGFSKIFISTSQYLAVHALAFKTEPSMEQYALLEKNWNLKPE
ncbi:MAG: class I SAM-dependent methyltransferase [Pseudomonadota bacterium]